MLCTQATQPAKSKTEPVKYIYREIAGRALEAYVFLPENRATDHKASAIMLFHGGGWSASSAEWTFSDARHFAALGMVAIAVEYRLSEGKITPIEALSDTCSAFIWVRKHAAEFNINPRQVVGYGVSAGGQLVAAAATIGNPDAGSDQANSRPYALLLWSPAVAVDTDGWFARLLQGRGQAADYSPALHASACKTPTCIVQGDRDTLTPIAGARRFCEQIEKAGGICELNVYEGLGHLLTRNLANQEDSFDPDPKASADGDTKHTLFLKKIGFITVK